MLWILFPTIMMFVLFYTMYVVLNQKHEDWKYQAWDFDDFPSMCRCKLKKTNEELAFANTPHFGGTPNNSQVWM